MKRNGTSAVTKLISLTLAVTLLASFTSLAAPGGTEPLSGGVMYEDEYVKVEYVEEEPENRPNAAPVMPVAGGVSISVTTPTIVAGLDANLNITLSGKIIPDGTVTVYLDINGQRAFETPIVGNKAKMNVAPAPSAGIYYLTVWGPEGFIARTPVEVVAYDTNIWLPYIRPALDGKAIVSFVEPISSKDGTLKDKVTVNSIVKTANFGGDGCSIVIDCPYGDLREGDIIVMTGIKYPRLFPSYSFTFTVKYTEGERYRLSMTAGNVYCLAVTAFEKANMGLGKYTLTYDPNMVELMDAAAQVSSGLLYRGTAEGAGINIQSHAGGVLIFNSTRPEENYSGVLTLLKFKAKADGETTVILR